MYTLGINCCFSPALGEFLPEVPNWFFHDASAVLLRDGKVVAAVEEERLNRIKHTSKFCSRAIDYCLSEENISLEQLDGIAFFFAESFADIELGLQYVEHPHIPIKYARAYLRDLIRDELGQNYPEERITFVKHHDAHAFGAYFQSGFDNSLVVVVDGQGEDESLSVYEGSGEQLSLLHSYPDRVSLGHFYSGAIQLLGYSLFDEYKVMGLAPYGDPRTYRSLFQEKYELLPEGEFTVSLDGLVSHFLRAGFVPRRRGEPFDQRHKDFASALQEVLETVMLHVVGHWQKETGLKALCLTGGVAHNCTMNAKLAYADLFERLFIHPAAHDAGAALGAALYHQATVAQRISFVSPYQVGSPRLQPVAVAGSSTDGQDVKFLPRERVRTVYWGPHIGEDHQIESMLAGFDHLVEYQNCDDIIGRCAELLAQQAVIGWVQGRSEFGPRALGNRSILADPRPADNKTRINAMVKKREGYRPFAPSILAEFVGEYFELPKSDLSLDFMLFNLLIREEKRELLGAVTHVNGTGRLQAVSKENNSMYWSLIRRFYDETGVPILLNTSFNNRSEPIVNNREEAVQTFLTTGLDYLAIGNFLVSKRQGFMGSLQKDELHLAPTARLSRIVEHDVERFTVSWPHKKFSEVEISKEAFEALTGRLSQWRMTKELEDLWSRRFLLLDGAGAYR
jgi:predicted NodU family carbamoyl transferase